MLAVGFQGYLCLQLREALLPWSRRHATYSNILIGQIRSRQIGSAPEESRWPESGAEEYHIGREYWMIGGD